MTTTIDTYQTDKDKPDNKRFYVKRGNSVFLTRYALACGYTDIQYGIDGRMYRIVERSGQYRIACYDKNDNTMIWMDYYPTLTEARSKINT